MDGGVMRSIREVVVVVVGAVGGCNHHCVQFKNEITKHVDTNYVR